MRTLTFNQFYIRTGKRTLDLTLAIPTIILLIPLYVFLAILVLVSSQGPIFFIQNRMGRNGRIFRLYKFRTMTNLQRAAVEEIIGPNPEVTRVGRWLRRYKLDELPQLWNVVTGDLSIVGPRPALPDQLKQYTELARRRLQVRPGLTGLSQVNGNIFLTWPERWRYDALYVEKLSFALDVRIILRTFAVLVRGESESCKHHKIMTTT